MIRSVIAFIVVNALAFLAFAFITWDINPANWEAGTRTLLVTVGSLLGSLGAIIAGDVT
jgi:uncharacterized membrane protein YhiD involved in acid resistance